MKKLCLVMYVFGDKYQEYIPLFLLSLFKEYPDYGVRIYLDRDLQDGVRNNMNMFLENDVNIIENYDDGLALTTKARKFEQIGKSIRWLVYDPAFEEYEAIYIGDIDILFFAESSPMFEEHIRHCELLGKPFSNICREHRLNKTMLPKSLAKNIIKFGIKQSIKFYMDRKISIKKLTGLHFVKTHEYYPALLKIRENYVNELNLLAEGKSKKYDLCSFNNESLLYDMMVECGFGETPEAEPGYNIATDGGQLSYRPHHGIHLGIFRGIGIMKNEKNLIESQAYKNFYASFEKLADTDEYKKIENNLSENIKELISNMRKYYANIV